MTKLCILVCGKTGFGKSTTLVNAILGQDITATGDPYSEQSSSNVKSFTRNIDSTTVTVYDSSDLRYSASYLDQIGTVLDGVDLVLYCLEMSDELSTDDHNEVKLITERFGMKLWSKSIVVLTKANQFQLSKSEESCEKTFNDIETDFKKQLKNLLPSQVSTINGIPVIAAGDNRMEPKDRELIFVSPEYEKHKDYLSVLWVQCLSTLPADCNSRLAFLQAAGSGVELSPLKKREIDSLLEDLKPEIAGLVGDGNENPPLTSRFGSTPHITMQLPIPALTAAVITPSSVQNPASIQNGSTRPVRRIVLDNQQSQIVVELTEETFLNIALEGASRTDSIGARIGAAIGATIGGAVEAVVDASVQTVRAAFGLVTGAGNWLFSRQ